MAARPRKPLEEKRVKRMTLYLTSAEVERLRLLAESKNTSVTRIVNEALNKYFKLLNDPPAPISKAVYDEIMTKKREQISGFICNRSHIFWVEWSWPSPPLCCPICKSTSIKTTWDGIVTKGF